jgi:hypothetical protein
MLGKSSKRLNPEDIRERLTYFLINFEDPEMEVEEEEPYCRMGKFKYRIIMVNVSSLSKNWPTRRPKSWKCTLKTSRKCCARRRTATS